MPVGIFLHEPVVHEEADHDPAAARRKGHLEQHGVRGREPQLERRCRRRVGQRWCLRRPEAAAPRMTPDISVNGTTVAGWAVQPK